MWTRKRIDFQNRSAVIFAALRITQSSGTLERHRDVFGAGGDLLDLLVLEAGGLHFNGVAALLDSREAE